MVGIYGVNLFRQSPQLRRLCCEVRKSRPLARALNRYDAWVTGLRPQQAATPAPAPAVAARPEDDRLTKIAPLAASSQDPALADLPQDDGPHDPRYAGRGTAICR